MKLVIENPGMTLSVDEAGSSTMSAAYVTVADQGSCLSARECREVARFLVRCAERAEELAKKASGK